MQGRCNERALRDVSEDMTSRMTYIGIQLSTLLRPLVVVELPFRGRCEAIADWSDRSSLRRARSGQSLLLQPLGVDFRPIDFRGARRCLQLTPALAWKSRRSLGSGCTSDFICPLEILASLRIVTRQRAGVEGPGDGFRNSLYPLYLDTHLPGFLVVGPATNDLARLS